MGKVLGLGPVHLYCRSWLFHMLEGPTQALTGLHPVSRYETEQIHALPMLQLYTV